MSGDTYQVVTQLLHYSGSVKKIYYIMCEVSSKDQPKCKQISGPEDKFKDKKGKISNIKIKMSADNLLSFSSYSAT